MPQFLPLIIFTKFDAHLLGELKEINWLWEEISVGPVLIFFFRKLTKNKICKWYMINVPHHPITYFQNKKKKPKNIYLSFFHCIFTGILHLLVSMDCALCCSKVQAFSFHTDQTFPPLGPDSGTKQEEEAKGNCRPPINQYCPLLLQRTKSAALRSTAPLRSLH